MYALGDVKIHHTKIRYGGNGVKCDFTLSSRKFPPPFLQYTVIGFTKNRFQELNISKVTILDHTLHLIKYNIIMYY